MTVLAHARGRQGVCRDRSTIGEIDKPRAGKQTLRRRILGAVIYPNESSGGTILERPDELRE